jgi:hypothetical protein
VKRQRVVHAVAEEADRPARPSQGRDQPGFLLWRDAGEDRVVSCDGVDFGIANQLQLRPGHGPFRCQTQFGTDLFGDLWIVTGCDLDFDLQRGQLRQRLARR